MSVLNSSKSIHKDGKYKNVQECPNGEVSEDTFKEIFEKFFPYGSESTLLEKDQTLPSWFAVISENNNPKFKRFF